MVRLLLLCLSDVRSVERHSGLRMGGFEPLRSVSTQRGAHDDETAVINENNAGLDVPVFKQRGTDLKNIVLKLESKPGSNIIELLQCRDCYLGLSNSFYSSADKTSMLDSLCTC